MPGHTMNALKNACTVCGMTTIEMYHAGTMVCFGSPTTPERAVRLVADSVVRDAAGPGDPQWEPTHEQFRAAIVAVAKPLLWECYWTHNSRRSPEGFPDLVMLRERQVVAELKVPPDKCSASQTYWGKRFEFAGVEYHLWMPCDWEKIVATLELFKSPSEHILDLHDIPLPPDRRQGAR